MRKSLMLSMAALSMAAAVTSCSNEETVKMPEQGLDLANAETISFLVKMPASEMRTRANEEPTLSYGEDGLYNFTRDIDKLWYAVYNNGTLLYHSMQNGVNQGVYNAEDQSFKLDIQIPKTSEQINLSEYSVFFFAGNALDNVKLGENNTGIGLDFDNKTLFAYPTILNKTEESGDFFNPVQYDFFAKYTSLDEVVATGYNGSVTLIRPFAQISLLTDELCQPAVLQAYASDGIVDLNANPAMSSTVSTKVTETLPYGWNYGTDELVTKDTKDLSFSLKARAFNNVDNTLTIPQQVKFKGRTMFCIGSYLMLAPSTRKAYKPNGKNEMFKFDINATGNLNGTDASISADVPAGGLKANEKYVMYNKKYSEPGEPGPGGPGGIFSTHYVLDIVVDPDWENSPIEY